jgi:transcription antitermination factor NusG
MPWYVMHSKPNKEEFLYEQLCIRKIDAYYPSVKVNPVNPRSRNRKPYFPGYLFIDVDPDIIGTSILKWMPGAIGIIDFGGHPASVPTFVLDSIRQTVDCINAVDHGYAQAFKSDDSVTVQSGPFAGYHAIFDSHLPGRIRVRVLLQMLRDRQVGVELSRSPIELLEKSYLAEKTG